MHNFNAILRIRTNVDRTNVEAKILKSYKYKYICMQEWHNKHIDSNKVAELLHGEGDTNKWNRVHGNAKVILYSRPSLAGKCIVYMCCQQKEPYGVDEHYD